MRTLEQITEAALDGQMPTHDECYWAMMALRSLNVFDTKALRALGFRPASLANEPKLQAEESFRRNKMAFAADPQVWCGPNHDYRDPEVQKRRQIGLKIVAKATGQEPPHAP